MFFKAYFSKQMEPHLGRPGGLRVKVPTTNHTVPGSHQAGDLRCRSSPSLVGLELRFLCQTTCKSLAVCVLTNQLTTTATPAKAGSGNPLCQAADSLSIWSP